MVGMTAWPILRAVPTAEPMMQRALMPRCNPLETAGRPTVVGLRRVSPVAADFVRRSLPLRKAEKRREQLRPLRRLQRLREWHHDDEIDERLTERAARPVRMVFEHRVGKPRNARRSARSLRKSAARPRRCAAGFAKPSETTGVAWVLNEERDSTSPWTGMP
jgi:hypothetical protein